jgi:hypothetical protein
LKEPASAVLSNGHRTVSGSHSVPSGVVIPKIPSNDPCIPHCDFDGGWKTAECQSCIFRGTLNGFLVRRGAAPDQLNKNKDFNLFALQVCRSLEIHHPDQVDEASFPYCFFEQIHRACNVAAAKH